MLARIVHYNLFLLHSQWKRAQSGILILKHGCVEAVLNEGQPVSRRSAYYFDRDETYIVLETIDIDRISYGPLLFRNPFALAIRI
jgi:hypothetical protein